MVVQKNEVELNSIRYPILGQIMPTLASQFAQKQVIGDFSKDSDPYASVWVLDDFRGGMLVEEADETKHADRFWWGTLDTRFKGEITLLPLATQVALPTIPAASIVNADMELTTGWTGGAQSTVQKRGGTYSWAVSASGQAYQDIAWDADYAGATFVFKCWCYAVGQFINIAINDGVDTTTTQIDSSGVWVQATVTKKLSTSATRLRLQLDAGNSQAYYDDATLPDYPATGTILKMDEFNGKLYIGSGNVLFKLNVAGDGWTLVNSFATGATFTELFHSGTHLYIFLGDAVQYQSMTTAEAFTATTNAAGLNATKGIYWDERVFKADSLGALSELTSPATATPTATARGTLPVADNDLQELLIYHNVDGDDIIYAATKVGLFAHDYTNSKFLETSLMIPSQANAGKGAVVWHDAMFISGGQAALRYAITNFAEISDIGLNRDDGLPQLRGGQIVKFIKGFDEFFALLDSTTEDSSSVSQVLSWDGKGWRAWWEATAANKNMYSGIVSSVVSQRLWWSTTDGIFWLALQVNMRKPKKVTGYTYTATNSPLITPWFDAAWTNGNKTAIRLVVSVRDTTADELVIVSYRLNHATTGVGSTWTSLGTISTDGLTTYNFGSSLGISFRSIQFRFQMVRGSTTTLSPVLEYATLTYERVLPKRWGWRFAIDCTKTYNRVAPDQLLANVITAAELETLTPFKYQDTTYYVRVQEVQGRRLTGEGQQGIYDVFVVEVV